MDNSSTSVTSVADHPRQLEILLQKLYEEVKFGRIFAFPGGESMSEEQRHEYAEEVIRLKLLWKRLEFFMDAVRKWSDAAEAVESCGIFVGKIEAIAVAIEKLLSARQQRSFDKLLFSLLNTEPQEYSLINTMDELRARALEFSDLDAEISRVVDSILGNFSSVKINSPLDDIPLWVNFALSTGEMMRGLESEPSSSPPNVNELAYFIRSVDEGFGSRLMLVSGDEKVAIEGFFARVSRVVFRVACLCFSSSKSVYPDTSLTEISLANIKFLDIIFKFLKALNNLGYGPASVTQADLVQFFLSSFSERGTSLHKELTEMVIYVIDCAEEPINEEDKYDLAEIKLVIVEAIVALRLNLSSATSRGFIVETKIWLRKVGLFLKEQLLSSGKIFMDTAEDRIDYLVNCLDELKMQYKEREITEDDMLIKEVCGELKSLYQSFCDESIEEYTVRISIYQLLSKVALLRAKLALTILLNLDEIVIDHCKSELWSLLEYIKLFVSTATIVRVDEEKTFVYIESICMRTVYLCYLFHTEGIKKETVKDLLNEMQMVKKQLAPEVPDAK